MPCAKTSENALQRLITRAKENCRGENQKQLIICRSRIVLLLGLRHFLAPKEAETLSGKGKEVDDLKMPETLVDTRFMHL